MVFFVGILEWFYWIGDDLSFHFSTIRFYGWLEILGKRRKGQQEKSKHAAVISLQQWSPPFLWFLKCTINYVF